MYYHFGSKEGLFTALKDDRLERLGRLVQSALEDEGPIVDRLRRFHVQFVEQGLRDLDASRFLLTCDLPDDRSSATLQVLGQFQERLRPLAGLIRQGVDEGELRSDLQPEVALLALLGVTHLHLLAALTGLQVTDHIIAQMFHTWLHGVSA